MLITVKVNILYSYVDCGKLAGKRGGTGGTAHSTGEKASAQTVSKCYLISKCLFGVFKFKFRKCFLIKSIFFFSMLGVWQ
jgi:hypothetical protein